MSKVKPIVNNEINKWDVCAAKQRNRTGKLVDFMNQMEIQSEL